VLTAARFWIDLVLTAARFWIDLVLTAARFWIDLVLTAARFWIDLALTTREASGAVELATLALLVVLRVLIKLFFSMDMAG